MCNFLAFYLSLKLIPYEQSSLLELIKTDNKVSTKGAFYVINFVINFSESFINPDIL